LALSRQYLLIVLLVLVDFGAFGGWRNYDMLAGDCFLVSKSLITVLAAPFGPKIDLKCHLLVLQVLLRSTGWFVCSRAAAG
jgi:hypothetical protein